DNKRAEMSDRRRGRSEIPRHRAHRLMAGDIIGWFHGRMELGPRALGTRSFLATPLRPEMKEILNARVKFREGFRPFAAIVLEEDSARYFDCDYRNPYMLLVYGVQDKYTRLIPASTHVPSTVLIPTVNTHAHP